MGRKKQNAVYRYFKLDENKKMSTCDVCGKVLQTQHGANLLKHLRHMHPEQFQLATEVNTATPIQKASVAESIIKECTNLVAIHGRPFSMIDDVAFQNLLKMIPNANEAVNSNKIRINIQSMADKHRIDMGTKLLGKFLCLKVDIASIATRCFLGINCQYYEDGHIVLKNLAVTEIFERHTSEHLKELLLSTLLRYRIDTHRIYSITTDNGANMLKMTKLLNELNSDVILPNTAEAGTSAAQATNDSDSDMEMESHQEMEGSEIEGLTTRLTENLEIQFQNIGDGPHGEESHSIGLVRCAAHTLQLALQDATNNVHTRTLLLECREVVRRLRTPQFVRLIRQEKKNIPKLDCTTRWHSAIDMVQSLLPLKEICATHERLHLSLDSWTALEDFLKTMTPAKILTKKLQEEQLTVGDFYIEWILCQCKLGKMNTANASYLITKMKEREKVLFESDTFINAIFLDPRVNSILTYDLQNRAKNNLIKLFFLYYKTQQKNNEINVVETNVSISESSEGRAELDDFLNTSYLNRLTDLTSLLRRDDPRGELINNLQQSFSLFLEEPLLKSTEPIFPYWEKSKLKFPLLYKLSLIVLATPMTQVSVERLFSSLRFIISNYRFSMKDQIIDDILFLRSNSIFDK